MADHARTFGASGFERLMLCPGSAVLTADAPRTSSQYSAEGTAIHAASADRLNGGEWPLPGYKVSADGFSFPWTDEMEEVGQAYVDYVLGLNGDSLWVEQRVSFGASIGLPADADDGFGTADAIVAKGSELIVVDLKCGRGVEVEAEDNPQLKLYALGALELLDGVAGDFEMVRLVIVQPRAGGVKEWVISKADLLQWAATYGVDTVTQVRRAQEWFGAGGRDEAADWSGDYLNPGEKQCKFCSAKATCPALRDAVADMAFASTPATPEEFDAVSGIALPGVPHAESAWLAACLSKVDMIEDWCKAVRAETERRMLAGDDVPGYKLVAGKKGNRQWSDAAEAETQLKTFRLKTEEMYDLRLISPTTAEKLAKAKVIGPRQWAKVTGLITQSEGKPHVAPVSDPRPAIEVKPVTEDFTDLTSDLA